MTDNMTTPTTHYLLQESQLQCGYIIPSRPHDSVILRQSIASPVDPRGVVLSFAVSCLYVSFNLIASRAVQYSIFIPTVLTGRLYCAPDMNFEGTALRWALGLA